MEKRKALGRGLQALIPKVTHDDSGVITKDNKEYIVYINTSEIAPSQYQPRTDFGQEKLDELIASIKEKGVVQPVLVRNTTTGYELIAGERRLRAAKSLKIESIPAIVKDVDDLNAMELAIIENVQREDLNPMEEARAYARLRQEFSFTQEMIAQAVGRERASVSNILRLLNLPEKIQQYIQDGKLMMGHARALLAIPDKSRQLKICDKIIKKGLSVREVEQLVRPHAAIRTKSVYKTGDPETRAVEESLQEALGTRVKIQHGKKRGKLIIEYLSPEDLERVVDIIKR